MAASQVSSERLQLSPVALRGLAPVGQGVHSVPQGWLVDKLAGSLLPAGPTHLHSQPACEMKLLARFQPLGGLGTNPASQVRMVLFVLLMVSLGPTLGCLTRSGQDAERVASKQGQEPEYHPQVQSKSDVFS